MFQEKVWVLWFQRVKDRFVLPGQDKPVFHTLESENPTFLMTAPVEKPSLNNIPRVDNIRRCSNITCACEKPDAGRWHLRYASNRAISALVGKHQTRKVGTASVDISHSWRKIDALVGTLKRKDTSTAPPL